MVKGTQRTSRRSKTRKFTTTNPSSNDPNNQSNHLISSKDTKSKTNKRSLRRTQSSAKAHIFNTDDKDQSKERQKSKERDKRKKRRKTKPGRVVEDQNEKDGVIQEIANEILHDGQSNVTSHDDIQMEFSGEEQDLGDHLNLGDEAIHSNKRARGRKEIEDKGDEAAEGTETEGDETGDETGDDTGTDETDETEGDESEEVDIEMKEDGSDEKSTFISYQTVNCNCFD